MGTEERLVKELFIKTWVDMRETKKERGIGGEKRGKNISMAFHDPSNFSVVTKAYLSVINGMKLEN